MEAAEARARASDVEHRVGFERDEASCSLAAAMNARLRSALGAAMAAEGLDPHAVARSARDDAAVFAAVGMPTGGMFVRNRKLNRAGFLEG